MIRSIQGRLVAGIVVTTIGGFAVAMVVVYEIVSAGLWDRFDETLDATARAIASLVERKGGHVIVELQELPSSEYRRAGDPEYYQLWTSGGHVLARSPNLTGDLVPFSPGVIDSYQGRQIVLPDGRHGRVAVRRFLPRIEERASSKLKVQPAAEFGVPPSDASVVLAVARHTADVEQTLARLGWNLLLFALLATLTTLAVLLLIVRRSLRPLSDLATHMAAVDAQSLARRFEQPRTPRELQPIIDRFNQLLERLQGAFAREKAFSADVAHELRTPLAGLRSTLDVALSRERPAADYQQTLLACRDICRETQQVVETLLALMRLESGHTPLHRQRVEIAQCLADGWGPFETRAAEHRIRVEWNCPAGLAVSTDLAQLRVVVGNLFDNALSYTTRDGTIRVLARRWNDAIEVEVGNTCTGPPPEAEQVFEPFWRGDASRSETGAHAGLGLSLCRRIMTLLSGSITARGEGTWFVVTVTLPATLRPSQTRYVSPHSEMRISP